LRDLQKNGDTGLIRLTDETYSGHPESVKRIEALERDIVAYFQSRKEDNNAKSIVKQPPPSTKTKPVISKPHRSTGFKAPIISSSQRGTGNRPLIWSSGPAGTHVDDHDPYFDQCNCPGHHHHHGNHNCPCSPDHTDDQHCWNPSEHEHHQHHHHTDHHFEGDHSSHGHEHHGDWDNTHHSGHDYGHSSGGGGFDYTDYGGHHYDNSSGGGGGFDNTDYGGHGSFY
jgi:hypothetical protein